MITDEMVERAWKIYLETPGARDAMRLALEAVAADLLAAARAAEGGEWSDADYKAAPAAPAGEPFVLTDEEKDVDPVWEGQHAYQPKEVRPGVYDWRLNPPKAEPAPTLSADLLTAEERVFVEEMRRWHSHLLNIIDRLAPAPKPAPSVLTPEETVGYAVTVYGTHEPAPTLGPAGLLTAEEREAFRAVFAEAEEIVPEEVGVACAVLARIAPKSAPVVAVESDPARNIVARVHRLEISAYEGIQEIAAALAARDRSAP